METSVSLLGRLAGAPTDDDWRRLHDLYQPLLRAWVARAGGPASDVDDLVQDVLSVVVRRIAGFEWRGQGAFRAWLRTILANEVRDYFRDQKYRHIATGDSSFQGRLDELESPDSALSRLWDREHDQYVVRRALELIEPEFAASTWRAFRRVMVDGAAVGAVAAELGLSANAVFIAKSRVLSRVRQVIRGLVD